MKGSQPCLKCLSQTNVSDEILLFYLNFYLVLVYRLRTIFKCFASMFRFINFCHWIDRLIESNAFNNFVTEGRQDWWVRADMGNPPKQQKFHFNKPVTSNMIGKIWQIQAISTKMFFILAQSPYWRYFRDDLWDQPVTLPYLLLYRYLYLFCFILSIKLLKWATYIFKHDNDFKNGRYHTSSCFMYIDKGKQIYSLIT